MSKFKTYSNLNLGPYPLDDGWIFLYKCYDKIIKPISILRFFIMSYFLPSDLELANNRKVYKILGVDKFGRYIPTGGISIRRITKAKMKPYTLKSSGTNSAREFFFRTIVFEFLHIPFLITMTILIIHHLSTGEYRFAMENLVINLLLNIMPILHHRNTRARIVEILKRKSS